MIKLLIGGSPCTRWSIAQKNNRETKAEGIGWELFLNYLYAKEKFRPDLFLYENNKSAAQPIKDQISTELDVDLMYINSALVSAQNRQRFYAFNWKAKQPQDCGILLKDVLESTYSVPTCINTLTNGKPRTVDAHMGRLENNLIKRMNNPNPAKQQYDCIVEPISVCGAEKEKAFALTATYWKASLRDTLLKHEREMIAEPIPINTTADGKSQTIKAQYGFTSVQNICCYDSTYGASGVAVKTEEHPTPFVGSGKDKESIKRVYEVKNGLIEVKGRVFPIKLPDGFYHIRKLTVTECCRLQTLPDDYCRAISPTQAYKGLGNGWTAEVIIHILNGALRNVPRDEEIVCLSMYDGIGTGRYCLDKMGFTNVRYYAYEIDKYAMTAANSNFSDIIQCGDAFDVRRGGWKIGG